MEHPPRAQSALQVRSSNFQVRASQMLKKVSNFRVRVPGRRRESRDSEGPYERQVRSLDGGPKPYMSQPCLALRMPDVTNPTDTDDSSLSISSANCPSRISGQLPDSMPTFSLQKALPQPPNSTGEPFPQTKFKEGIPRERPDDIITGPPLKFEGLPNIVISEPPIPPSKRTPNHAQAELPTKRRRSREGNADRPKLSHSSDASTSASPGRSSPAFPPPPLPASSSSPSQPTPKMSSSSGRLSTSPQLQPLSSPSLRFHAQGDLRLSPSIIYRPPMPIRNLPTLPTSTPGTQPTLTRVPSRRRLRTMPALPREGTNDDDFDPDHENSELGDSDEDEDADATAGGGGSDDDEEDEMDGDAVESTPASERSSTSSRQRQTTSTRTGLPIVDTSRLDLSFLNHSPVAGPSNAAVSGGEKTPKARNHFDYFSVEPREHDPSRSPARTPRAREGKPKPSGAWRPSQVIPTSGTGSEDSMRPGIYRQASKSMVNLALGKDPTAATPTIMEEDLIASIGKGKGKAREPSQIVDHTQESSSQSHAKRGAAPAYDHQIAPSLTRRRSMPTFNPTTAPPPYPSFAPHAHPMQKDQFIQPRDDEGKEQLPPYSNTIYLKAIMPRKVEFSSPGVQSKDRKWRRVLCILEGTAFKVYKCPSGASGAGLITEWWENKVGVGDVTLVNGTPEPPPKKKQSEKIPKWDRERIETRGGQSTTTVYLQPNVPSPASSSTSSIPAGGGGGNNRSRINLAASLLKPSPNPRGHSRTRSDLSREGVNVVSGKRHRSSTSAPLPSTSHLNVGVALPSAMAVGSNPSLSNSISSLSSRQSGLLTPRSMGSGRPKLDLIKAYTLQHAESGLGNDYAKRKNVIRVRMEGEQFLLQANDVAGVVEWIEAIHAATNIALDLDERVMPKGPMFPRRRRRRRRAEGGNQGPSESGPVLPSSPT